MSFSGEVKNELCRTAVVRACCACAEMYGVFLCCHTFTPREIRIITESQAFAQRLPKLLERAFGVTFDRVPREEEQKFIFQITQSEKLRCIVVRSGMTLAKVPCCISTLDCWRRNAVGLPFCAGYSCRGAVLPTPANTIT